MKFIENIEIENKITNPFYEYYFSEPGVHYVIVQLKIEHLETTELMFSNINNLISIKFSDKIFNEIKSIKEMFKNCTNLRYINFNNNNFNKLKDSSHLFENCVSLNNINLANVKIKEVENISYMFSNCFSLKSIDLSGFDTMKIKDMSGLFYLCSSLISIDLSSFNTNNILNMKYMFAGCSSITKIDLNFLKIPNYVDMSYMFKNCFKLTSIELPKFENINLISKEGMFSGCESLSKNKFDICIIGYWFGTNFGSLATYFALHQVIKNMGYSIMMIDSPIAPLRESYYDKCHPITIGRALYNISKQKSLDKVFEYNNECRKFVVGSDQLWKPLLSRPFKQFFFLDFADNMKKKISYGTSFGDIYDGTEEEKTITKSNLKRFNLISVRDKLSLNITKDIFKIKDAVQVCDPSFICNFSDYESLVNKSKIIFNKEYILAYVLDANEEKGHRLEKLSVDKNITVIIILDERQETWERNKGRLHLRGKGNVIVKEMVDLNDFMWLFNNSKAVFTDSFHGTIFSIIFKKPFVTLRNVVRGGERFFSLLDPLDLRYRLFESPSCINDRYDLYDKIDYEIPYKKLNEIKKFSYNWLENALKDS